MSLSLIKDYISSDEDEPPIKRFPPPQLPQYSVPISISREPISDPKKHQNRKRSFPHEAGNWATFVAIKFPIHPEFQDFLDNLLEYFSPLDFQPVDDFHISLSRVVILRHHWINDFVATLKNKLGSFKRFNLTFEGLSTYVNEDKSRTFVALKVDWGSVILNDVVNIVDETLAEYSLPKFYSDRSFHMSLLWGLGDKSIDTRKVITDSLPSAVTRLNFPIETTECYCKSGNKYFSIPLS